MRELNFVSLQEKPELVQSSSRLLLHLKSNNNKNVASEESLKSINSEGLELPVARRIMKYLHRRWQQGKFCDVKLKCQDATLVAHGVILSAYSPTLDDNLGDWRKVEMPVIDVTVFPSSLIKKILEFLYTTDIEITDEFIDSLTYCSKYLDILDLFKICCDYLSHYDAKTAILYYIVAKTNDINVLANCIWKFLCANFEDVVNTDYFIACDFNTMRKLLSDSTITISSEANVLQAAISWLDADSGRRRRYATRVMDCVRLTQMNPEEIIELESNPYFTSIPDFLRRLYHAMCYHCLQKQGAPAVEGFQSERRTGPLEDLTEPENETPVPSEFKAIRTNLLMPSERYCTPEQPVPEVSCPVFAHSDIDKAKKNLCSPSQSLARAPHNKSGAATEIFPLPEEDPDEALNLTMFYRHNVKKSDEALDLRLSNTETNTERNDYYDPYDNPQEQADGISYVYPMNTSAKMPSYYIRRATVTPISNISTETTEAVKARRATEPFIAKTKARTMPENIHRRLSGPPTVASPFHRLSLNKSMLQEEETPKQPHPEEYGANTSRRTSDGRKYSLRRKMKEKKLSANSSDEMLPLDVDEGAEVSPVRRTSDRLSLTSLNNERHNSITTNENNGTDKAVDSQDKGIKEHGGSVNPVSQTSQVFADKQERSASESTKRVSVIEESTRLYMVENMFSQDAKENMGNRLLCFDDKTKMWNCVTRVPQFMEDTVVLPLNGALYILGAELCYHKGKYQAESTDLFFKFELATGTWHCLAPMLIKRFGHRAVIRGGKIYVVGGIDENMRYVTVMEEYDPNTNIWSNFDKMPQGRLQPSVCVCDDKLFMMGGSKNEGNYAHELLYRCFSTGNWHVCKKFSQPFRCTALVTIHEVIYLIGLCQSDENQKSINQILQYDRENDQWSTITYLTTQRCDAAHIAIGDTIVILGGVDPRNRSLLKAVDCFDVIQKCLRENHGYADIPAAPSTNGVCVVKYFLSSKSNLVI